LFGSCILLSSVVSLLTPAAARIHIGLVIALRVLSGLGEGVMRPASQAMIARWSAPQHRSTVVGVIGTGFAVASIVGLFLAGILCDYGFAGGWPSVFYVFGMVGCVWFVCWCFLCYNSPYTHPRISTAEFEYFETMIGEADLARHPPTPWRKILTSVPVWALAIAYLASNYQFYTLASCLPLYMREVLGFNMTNTGLFSALSFLAMTISFPISSAVADWLRSSGKLSTGFVRKAACVSGFILADCCLIPLGLMGCNRVLAVVAVFFLQGCQGVVFSTVECNQLDLAPLHVGNIYGLTYTVANLGSIVAPYVVSAMTAEQSARLGWQMVFFLLSGVGTFGAIVYVIFGSGNRQSWSD